MKPGMQAKLCIVIAAMLVATSAGPLWGQNKRRRRPKVVGEAAVPVWSPYANFPGRQVYLGPTGARGWVGSGRIVVTTVAPGSPGAGVLAPNDIIVAAGGKPLADDADPRLVLGNAITAAESRKGRGRLALKVIRAGSERTVSVRLPVMGDYAQTWPFNCKKSERILAEACDHMAAEQFPDGHTEGEGIMATAWNALTLLAADDPKYLDNVRRAVYHMCETDYAKHDLRCWALGYGGIVIAEYYLATGDETVIPKLKEMMKYTADGQMSSGTWGHNIPWGAYGGLNQAGLVCWMMLNLGEECGLRADPMKLKKASAFFGKFAGRGGIPYGDHLPTSGRGSNGKDALGAVGFQLEADTKKAMYFANLVSTAYEYRENGHTGCFLSIYWGPVAAHMAGESQFRTFMDYQKWYYDLSRTHTGGMACQPNPENLGGRTNGVYTHNGTRFTTGGMALAFALPKRAVRVLGGDKSVFGAKIDGPIAKARDLYQQRKWAELAKTLAQVKVNGYATPENKRFAVQLVKAADRQRTSVALTLTRFDELIAAGDVYYAHELLEGLKRRLGADAPELAAATKTMAANDFWVKTGRDYYQSWAKLQSYTWQSWHYYGKKLTEAQIMLTPPAVQRWQALAATSDKGQPAQTWRRHQWGDEMDAAADVAGTPVGWATEGFDDARWAEVKGPAGTGWSKRNVLLRRTFNLDAASYAELRMQVTVGRGMAGVVYLNGTPVFRVEPGPWRGYAKVKLPASALRLLKKGVNVLAIRGERGSAASGAFDVGIDGCR